MIRLLIIPTLFGIVLHASGSFANGVSFKRSYVDLDWGQMHLLTARPEDPSSAPAVVCFAPRPTPATITGY